jgi:uncharacterized protein (DUF2249 family)
LDEYPFLEEELIKLNPKFKKLKNPVLRRTVARIASVKQAAKVGGMDPGELLNFLRQKVGQAPVDVEVQEERAVAPEWITAEPKIIIDGNKLLDEGKNPLAELSKAIKDLHKGDVVLLLTDFRPEPLIEEMKKRGHEVYSDAEGERHYTYVLV